ncbi:glycosyltransferase family 4 protein [Larkinella sp. VNQ87]|uniref:glycosyltransferase family 4 protein n=1 Tax=Larkinella sp. VNQ87 TaxID=3400921 RepID=UPI003C01B283
MFFLVIFVDAVLTISIFLRHLSYLLIVEKMVVVHVARIDLNYESGMSRVASWWRNSFLKDGHEFYHIGLSEVNSSTHRFFWGYSARKYLNQLNIKCDILLVHEPLAGFFVGGDYKLVVFSHGVEERGWLVAGKYGYRTNSKLSTLLPGKLKFYSNNLGFKKADKVLVLNQEDSQYLINNKKIDPSKVSVYQNGYYPFKIVNKDRTRITFLYNATWIVRKGTPLMYNVFNRLLNEFSDISLLIAGTGLSKDEILKGFDKNVWSRIDFVKKFSYEKESELYSNAHVFLMPSYFEGQSLALTQAMAMGLVPIASDNSGQKDFIIPYTNGLLFQTGNAQDFENKIRYLLEHKSKLTDFGTKARDFVSELTWEKVSMMIVDICKSIVMNSNHVKI